MADSLMPGVRQVRATQDGGSMVGGPPRVIWHTTEYGFDPLDIAHDLNANGTQVHLVWQPKTGDIVQLVSAHRAGRGLENDPGGVQTNRMGRVNIQIEVVADAADPFTDTDMKNLDRILAWLDSWGIPREWPAGRPGGNEMYGPNPQRSSRTWRNRAGHYGHSQVPENAHWDPGRIDIDKLLQGGDDVSAKDVWTWDRIRVPWKRKGDKNINWQSGHALESIWDNAYRAHVHAREMHAQITGLSAAVKALAESKGLDGQMIADIVGKAVHGELAAFEAKLADAEVVLRTSEENP